jgi:hypothetical protein
MQENPSYKIFNKEALLIGLRIWDFVVEDNYVMSPLKHNPRKCHLDFVYAGEIVEDRYLIINKSFMHGSCKECRDAISKLETFARGFEQ